MRPLDWRDSSMARSAAQSECVELSTGTKISRYTGTSPLGRGEYVSHETGCQVTTKREMQRLDAQTHRGEQAPIVCFPLRVCASSRGLPWYRSEEHTSELQSLA